MKNIFLSLRNFFFPSILLKRSLNDSYGYARKLLAEKESIENDVIVLRYHLGEIKKSEIEDLICKLKTIGSSYSIFEDLIKNNG